MKTYISIILCFIYSLVSAQADTLHLIKVHFLYGSKPLYSTRKDEGKYFGGLHGGHISIEVDSIDYGFGTGKRFHLFFRKKNITSEFTTKRTSGRPPYPEGDKFVTFLIPLSEEQYISIKQIHTEYTSSCPYDYAFFGMRCASATQDILGQIDVVRKRKRFCNVLTTFYPKKLRKRMFRLAKEKNYRIIIQPGRKTRKWEGD